MKKLYLVRHAKSSWANPGLNDFDRPLNNRGEKDSPRMARRLKERGVTPDIVLTSPANRALSTCLKFCEILRFQTDLVRREKKLYHASEDQLLEIVQALKDRRNDEEETVLLFGHNPGLTEFANALAGETIDNIPTCGIVLCEMRVPFWKDVTWGCAKLTLFDFPKKEK